MSALPPQMRRSSRCFMTPLAEPLRDGRLSERERASIERHLDDCEECRGRQRALARLAELAGAPPPALASATALDHRRGRMRLLQAAALLDTGPGRSTLGGVSRSGTSHSPRSGVRWAMPAAAVLAANALVGAGRWRSSGAPATSAWPAASGATAAAPVASTEGAADPPLGEETPSPGAVASIPSAAEPAGTATPQPLEGARPPTQRVAAVAPARRDRFMTGEPPRPSPPASSMGGDPARSAPRAPVPEESFAAGVGSMEQGNFGEAIERLGAFRKSHPGDSRAEDAAFLVIVALQRAGRHEAAAAAAREYLASYPAGYRRGDAQRIAARRE